MTDCIFCDYNGPSKIIKDYGRVIVFEPLQPVTPGHVLVLHKQHSNDFAESPGLTAEVAAAAAKYMAEVGGEANLITSKGEAATQSVGHLHFHIVPRVPGDGLALPWSDQH